MVGLTLGRPEGLVNLNEILSRRPLVLTGVDGTAGSPPNRGVILTAARPWSRSSRLPLSGRTRFDRGAEHRGSRGPR